MESSYQGGSSLFGHERKHKGDFLAIIFVDIFIGDEVEGYGVEPHRGLFKESIVSFGNTNVKFYWFSGGGGGGHG